VWLNVVFYCLVEFNKGYVLVFMVGELVCGYICVYLFVWFYEWYLLFDDECKCMLYEYGMVVCEYFDVCVNMVLLFVLGDYEWIFVFEVDELYCIVDVMCDLCVIDVCWYVWYEVLFFIGLCMLFVDFVDYLF